MQQLHEQLKAAGVASFPCWARYNAQRGRWDKGPAIPKGVSWQTLDPSDPSLDWSSGVVGVPIPADVVVLDLDTYKGVTRQAVEAHLGCALDWDRALIQRTIGGGEHYAFKCNWDTRQGDSIGVQGLDTRSAGRGFICSGNGYSPVGFGVFALGYPDSLPCLPDAARAVLERVPDAPPPPPSEPVHVNAVEVEQALSHIDPGCSRSEWRNVGFALKALFAEDDSAGYHMFERWSAGEFWPGGEPDNYVIDGIGSCLSQWGSFKASGKVRPATLFYKAIEAGWRPPVTFNTAAAFGPGAAPADTFRQLVTRIHESGADILQTQAILEEITSAGCNGLQVSLLTAELKLQLKDAGINDANVRRHVDAVAKPAAAAPRASGVAPAPGQVLSPDTPMHSDMWAPMHTKGKDMKPKGTSVNFEIMLQAYGIRIEFDEIRKTLRIKGEGIPDGGVLREEAALGHLESLANLNEYPVTAVRSMILKAANDNTVNPVIDWVGGNNWDGRDHVGDLWRQILLERGEDAEFCEVLFRKWLRGAYSIGAGLIDRWEFVVVLVDPSGGAGKTRFFSTLCPPDLQTDSIVLDTANKDSVKLAISYWLTELGELDGTFTKSDSARLKAFLSLRKDEMRLPYGRAFLEYPRRTAFWASVNAPHYLVDPSDNRRYWGIRVAGVNYKHDVDTRQVWAQVAAEVAAGHAAHLTDEESNRLVARNEAFRSNSPIADALSAMALRQGGADTHQTLSQILLQAGVSRPSKTDLNEAAQWLRRAGFNEVRHSGKRGYNVVVTPATATAFQVIEGGKK